MNYRFFEENFNYFLHLWKNVFLNKMNKEGLSQIFRLIGNQIIYGHFIESAAKTDL